MLRYVRGLLGQGAGDSGVVVQLSSDGARGLRLDGSVTLEFLVAERHPLAAADAELLSIVGACESRSEHHLALDDALLHLFGGEKVRVMLERLGANEEEPISSSLIGRSILKAQQKIGARARDDLDAHSAAEWLERNTQAGSA